MVTDRKSSKLVVLLTGMVSLIYAVANPIIYGRMSMRYRWAYKRVFGAACRVCRQKPRSWSLSSISKHYFLILSFRCGVRRKPTVFPRLLQVIWFFFTLCTYCMLHVALLDNSYTFSRAFAVYVFTALSTGCTSSRAASFSRSTIDTGYVHFSS